MRKFLVIAGALAALLAGPLLTSRADAAALGTPAGIGLAAENLNLVEKTQFVYLGRHYCWYPVGWHGPGWYWCGYGWRTGLGWGGPVGWRGWVYRGPAVVVRRPVIVRRPVVVRRGPVIVRRGPVVVHRRVIVRHHH